ncbi:MAG: N-acetylmuramoyl-L-alanine amidase [Geminicoccaceae bacterium]|nr:N-acetylmuramoyl-L-alanine amidase [Geminicoccaceae bacterium]
MTSAGRVGCSRNCTAARATASGHRWSSIITTVCSIVSERRLSPSHGNRPPGAVIDMIILHYTGMQDGRAALDRLCDPEAEVSAHYLVEEDGRILALVDEERQAWHAGVSGWGGRRRLNDVSIGIEIVNPGHEWGYRPFPEQQMQAVERLVADIVRRRAIRPALVLGHSDVAPARKDDPGELFEWSRLARQGLAVALAGAPEGMPDRELAVAALRRIGYDFELPATEPWHVIRAFQRRFRPSRVDGVLDAQTMGLIMTLEREYPSA